MVGSKSTLYVDMREVVVVAALASPHQLFSLPLQGIANPGRKISSGSSPGSSDS